MEPQLPYDRKIEEPRSDTEMSPPGDDERSIIAAALGPSPVETDDIIRHTGFSAATVHLVLLELDIAGRLNRHAGGACRSSSRIDSLRRPLWISPTST